MSPTSTEPLVMPWRSARFIAYVCVVPLLTLAAMILWRDNARLAFRVIQLCFGWAVVAQFILVLSRVFERGWYEFFAYLLHFLAIGAASLTVTFRLEQYPQDLLYDQMALLGMAGQLVLGIMVLANGPLRQQAKLDTRVLTILTVVVCSAALVKFGFYLQYTGFQTGSHLEIYTEGDALRDNSPAVVRILAAGAPLIGLLALTQPGLPRWCRLLGGLAIVLEFAIGIRSRPLFIILSALALTQYRFTFTPARKMLIAGGAVIAVIALGAIGYFREQNSVPADEYFWIVLESLFGIFEAGVLGAQLPETTPIIFGQLGPLLAPTPLGSIDTIAKLLTSVFASRAYFMGYGYSSSALTEITMLFGPVTSSLFYPLGVFGIVVLIKSAVTSKFIWSFLYGACAIPIAYYIWRAELWQLAVPVIKALPFIAVVLGVDAYARLAQPRRALRPPPPTRRPHTS